LKIAITGHTRGIGQACAELLGHEHDIVGYSRSTGCNISDSSFPTAYWSDIDSCDVFINNACDQDAQLKIVRALFDRWKRQNKIIINIGAIGEKLPEYSVSRQHAEFNEYCKNKIEFHQAVNDMQVQGYTCRVLYILVGAVRTDFLQRGIDQGMFPAMPDHALMEPKEIAEAIHMAIDNPNIVNMELFKSTKIKIKNLPHL